LIDGVRGLHIAGWIGDDDSIVFRIATAVDLRLIRAAIAVCVVLLEVGDLILLDRRSSGRPSNQWTYDQQRN
jgi:hypothetical protein